MNSRKVDPTNSIVGLFPDLAEAIKVRVANVRDLMVPFRKRGVYRWQIRGSYAIKQVLPVMQAYHDMCALEVGEGLEQLRQAMLDYCRLDTLAMVRILGELEAIGKAP